MLLDIKSSVKARTIIYYEIIGKFDKLLSEKPCSFVRLAFEKAMFVDNSGNETILFNEEPFESFIRRHVVEIHPFIKPFLSEQVWTEFFEKYLMMMKELMFVCLRN